MAAGRLIIVDVSTNRTLRVWHEGGEEGATLMSVLKDRNPVP